MMTLYHGSNMQVCQPDLKRSKSPAEALDVLYTSDTFDRLQQTDTGFYFQSVGYVASFLKNEIEKAVFM